MAGSPASSSRINSLLIKVSKGLFAYQIAMVVIPRPTLNLLLGARRTQAQRSWSAVTAGLAIIGVALLVAELLAICFLRYESAEAMRPLSMGAAAVCVAALIQIAAAGPQGWRTWLTRSTLWCCGPFVAYAAAVTASGWRAPAGAYPDIVIEAWWFAGLAIATAQIAGHVRGRRFTLAILIASLAVLMPGVLGPKSAGDLSGRFLRYSSLLHWGAYPEIGMLACSAPPR